MKGLNIFRKVILLFLMLLGVVFAEKIKVVTTTTWEPFNMMTKGRIEGIGVDFWKLVAKKADINYTIHIVDRWCDVLKEIKNGKSALTLSTGMTEERKKYAVFSKPYVIYPLAIATKNDIGFIFDMKYLKDKIIAIGHNYTAAKLMLKNFPNFKYIFLNTTDEALKMLEKGEVYAVVDILPVLAYKINKYEFKDLKIAGQIPIRFPVRFMLSKKYAYLLPKLNKAIDLITTKEKEKIYNKYIVVNKKYYFTQYEMLFYFLIIASVLIMLFLWIYVLKGEIVDLKNEKASYDKNCDVLTGIYNKYKISKLIDEKLKNNKAISLMAFDIRDFKGINRFYGHHFGDITLLELASSVKSILKKNEHFARINGGTFIIMLTKTEIGACERAKEIYEAVQNLEFSIVKDINYTFVVKTFYNEKTSQEILAEMENELQKNKKNNRVFTC